MYWIWLPIELVILENWALLLLFGRIKLTHLIMIGFFPRYQCNKNNVDTRNSQKNAFFFLFFFKIAIIISTHANVKWRFQIGCEWVGQMFVHLDIEFDTLVSWAPPKNANVQLAGATYYFECYCCCCCHCFFQSSIEIENSIGSIGSHFCEFGNSENTILCCQLGKGKKRLIPFKWNFRI